MNVLSLFDGMSCGQIALKRVGIEIDKYYASEIDKWAIKITQKNYPDTIQLGDINQWKSWNLNDIDILIGGSPCQGFSNAGSRLNFDDPRSRLFFTFVDVLKFYNPTYFLLENVKMKKEWQNIITDYLGVEPIEINSALVSAQNRKRIYWTNIHGILQPKDRGILLKDIIEGGTVDRDKSYCIDACYYKGGSVKQYTEKKRRQIVNLPTTPLHQSEKRLMVEENRCIQVGTTDKESSYGITNRINSINGKSPTLPTCSGGRQEPKITLDEKTWRKLTPLECERLQTVPDRFTEGISNTQRYKMLGNGWTVDVIAHIFSFIVP